MILESTLENVVLTQKDKFEKKENLIQRELDINLQNKFAVIISGVRRCGKSTLMDLIAKKITKFNYINFEDPRISEFQLADFETLEKVFEKINGKSNHYFFDEIQLIDKWEFHVRRLLDENKYLVITGSNASLLSKELGTKLTGRNLRYELFPFSYSEFLNYKKLKKGLISFNEYLKKGGFPEFLLLEDAKILRNLVSDSLIRDIATRHKIKNIKELTEIAIYLISNVGKEVSYTSLTKMFNLGSTNTTSKYISYLEDAYLLFTINKFDYSLKKQIVNPKKVYAIDTGVIIHNSKTFTEDFGRLLENLVFIELKRRGKEIFYFKEKNECDFVTREGTKITSAIQVCYELTEQNKEREINGLVEALEKFNLKEGVILTLNQEQEFVVDSKKVKLIPVWKWLLEQ
ncbi:MAG: ATP-binding protein [Candidatus Nanoarchaeia archaeon]|nr:ATP-binding protein [Candidatus Nanoarchaeia archaeon]